MGNGDDVDSDRYQGNHEPPETKRRSWAGFGTLVVAAAIGAAVVGNILSLKKRLLNFQELIGQGSRSRQGTSEHVGSAARQAGRKTQQQTRRPQFHEVDQRFWEEHIRTMERIRRVQQAFESERKRARRNDGNFWEGPWGQQGYTQTWEWRWEGGRWVGQRQSEHHWTEGDRRWANEESKWQRSQADSHPYTISVRHHYKVLGLDPSKKYTDAEIKAAYRSKALQFHPDRNQGNQDEAGEKFRQVTEAYNALRGTSN